MRAAAETGVHARAEPQRLGALLTAERGASPRYRAAWADCCGAFDGCAATGIFPRHDIRKMLDYGMDMSGGAAVLAVTLCKRNSATPADAAAREIAATAELKGLRATVCDEMHYHNMALYVFRVEPRQPTARELEAALRAAPWMSRRLARDLAADDDRYASVDAVPPPLKNGELAGRSMSLRSPGGAWRDARALCRVPGHRGWHVVAYKDAEPCGKYALELIQFDEGDESIRLG